MSIQRTDFDLLRRIGGRIASYRTAAGLTQAELAERVGDGVEAVSLSRWETGARSPSVTMLYAVAQALGVGVGDLVDDEAEDQEKPAGPELGRVLARADDQQRDLVTRIAIEVLKSR